MGRIFKVGDAIGAGFDEILRAGGEGKGFNYLNPRVRELMKEHNAAVLGRVNPYTGVAQGRAGDHGRAHDQRE
ncbi:MAG: hypothetical protein WKF75_03915 [Singulisphaera sp.]